MSYLLEKEEKGASMACNLSSEVISIRSFNLVVGSLRRGGGAKGLSGQTTKKMFFCGFPNTIIS